MRIDKFLAEKYGSRNKAANAISRGLITVNGKAVTASYEIGINDLIEIKKPDIDFVSAGGFKLQKAIKDFNLCVDGGVFADIGASTGGFTDCLFQCGAKKVYCIDVGESQLDESLYKKNVVVIDNFNARNLNKDLFCEPLDGIVIDVSFISLTYILKAVSDVITDGKTVLALIKPQFECESRRVGKNGIVTDVKLRENIIKKIYSFAQSVDLSPVKITNAPIVKGKNKEYIILLVKNGKSANYKDILESVNL